MNVKVNLNLFATLQLALLVPTGCSAPRTNPPYEEIYESRDATILDVVRVLDPRDFTRQNLLKQFSKFHAGSNGRKYLLKRLTITPHHAERSALRWSNKCRVGQSDEFGYFSRFQAAQVIVFQGLATALIKIGDPVETIDLSGSGRLADKVIVDGFPYRLSSFRIAPSAPDGSSVSFYLVGDAPSLTKERARRVLEEMMLLTGTKSAGVILRRDYFFGKNGGPYLDVLRSPTRAYLPPGEIAAVACSIGNSEDACRTIPDRCFERAGPRADL